MHILIHSVTSLSSLLLYLILKSLHLFPSLTLSRTVSYCTVFTYVQWSIDERISTADSEHVQRYSGIISVLTPLESTYVNVHLHSIIRPYTLMLILFLIITCYCILIYFVLSYFILFNFILFYIMLFLMSFFCSGYTDSPDLLAWRASLREANGDDDAVAVAPALSLPVPVLPVTAGVGGVGGGSSSSRVSCGGMGVSVTGVSSSLSSSSSAAAAALQPSTDPLSLPLSLPLPVPLHISSSNPPSPSPSFSPSPALLIPPLQPSLLSSTKSKTPTPFSPYNAHTVQEKKNKITEIKKKNLRGNQIFKKLLKKEKIIFSAMNFPGSWTLEFALDERELFSFFSAVMHKHDPDIIIGYEVQKESLGYLLKRGDVMGK